MYLIRYTSSPNEFPMSIVLGANFGQNMVNVCAGAYYVYSMLLPSVNWDTNVVHMNTNEERTELALAKQVKVELAERDMTQTDLAEAAGVGRPAMNRYLQGKSSMPMPTFLKVASVLGLGPDVLMSRIVERASKEG